MIDKEIREAEERGQLKADVAALKDHKKEMNGHLKSMDTRLGNIERAITAREAEKKGIISLQNRQVAFFAAIGTALYLLVEHVH